MLTHVVYVNPYINLMLINFTSLKFHDDVHYFIYKRSFSGFSRQIIDLLNGLNVDYWTFDILQDNAVREGLKVYSDWPTYPQLYLDGELLGGLDVIKEEIKNPEFVDKLPKMST